ncbi:MAG TPA: 50S ribosomal protein L29 [Candidatus Paceibacterota bacterium]
MKELNKKNDKELEKELRARSESLREFRFGIAGSKLKNVREGRSIRKEIARIKTELNTRKHNA